MNDKPIAPVKTKLHLLVIDDEIEIAKLLQRQFRLAYNVHIATNADEATHMMTEYPVHIVISDQRMPRVTGVSFFARIKHTHPSTIRILMTGYDDIEAVTAAINEGNIFRYVKKPWDRLEMEHVLDDASKQYHLLEQTRQLLNELGEKKTRNQPIGDNLLAGIVTHAEDSVLFTTDAAVQILGGHVPEDIQDITERKQTEYELRRSEQRYRSLFLNAPVMMHSIDRDGHLLNVSNHWLDKMGYTADEVIGHQATEFMTDESRRYAIEHVIPDYFNTGLITNIPVQFVTKTAAIIDVFLSTAAEWDEHGELVQSVTVITDVTKSKRVEAALQESELRYRGLFENALEAILIANDEARYVDANPAACKLLGYSREKLLELSMWDITPLPDKSQGQDLWHVFIAAGKMEGEYTVQCQDGSTRVVEFNAVANVQPGLHMSRMRDITKRQNAEEKSRKVTLLLEDIGKMAKIGGWELDLLTKESYFTDETFRIHGLQQSDSLNVESGINFYAPEARPIISKAVDDAIEKNIPYALELPFVTAQGRDIWVRTHGRVHFEDGKAVRLYGSIQDITERKRAEKAEHDQRELAEALADIGLAITATADLQQLVEDILDKVERFVDYDAASLGRFADDRFWPFTMRGFVPEFSADSKRNGLAMHELHLAMRVAKIRKGDFITWTPEKKESIVIPGLPQAHTRLAVPLLIEGHVIGLLIVIRNKPDCYNDTHIEKLNAFAHHAAVAFQKVELFERQRQLTRQLVVAQEEERRQVAHELHDEAGQTLTALRLSLQVLGEDLVLDVAQRERIESVIKLAQATGEHIRNLSYGLRPPLLDTLGLNMALQSLCDNMSDHTQLDIVYSGQEMTGLSNEVKISFYRILQETLTNAVRHADCTRITVSFSATETYMSLQINDNGKGFEVGQVFSGATRRSGLGLLGMRERAELLNGVFEVRSQPGQGTQIKIVMPRS